MSASLTLVNNSDFSGFDVHNGSADFTTIRGMAASSDGSKLYVAIVGIVGYGIMFSSNYGVSWQTRNPNDGNGPWSFTSVACSSDGTIVYAANLGNGLYKSTDSGQTWNYIVNGQALPGIESNFGYTTYNVYQIACDATGNKLIMTTNLAKVIYRSIDGGATWTNIYNIPNAPDNPHSPITLASNVNGSVLYAAFNNTDNKIYKSTNNGVTWNIIQSLGTVTGPFSGLSSNLTGDFVFACNNAGLTIFYDTHVDQSILTPSGGSLITVTACYNNGNNVLVMVNNATQTYVVTNTYPPGNIPGDVIVSCFKENTKIRCYKDGKEQYINIQELRKGDLVKTAINGYVAVNMIGTTKIYNSGNVLRGKNRLYVCRREKYPQLNEDLILTGCHAILVDDITETQRNKMVELLGNIYVTDQKYRLLACVDENADPYPEEGVFNIWHLALDNTDYYMNYGIYANGLLVETCSQRFLKEYSGMTLV